MAKVHLTTYPRYHRGHVDEGKLLNQNIEEPCSECGGGVVQTVSLEYCSVCQDIKVDYWPHSINNTVED